MFNKYINNIVKNIGEASNYNKEQFEIVEYVTKVILYEVIKILFILIVFSFIGYFKESLLIILIMSFTKPFIGGYHENTQIKCFIVTLLLVAVIIVLYENNKLGLQSCIILNLINIFVIYNKAPIINNKMLITKENLIKRNRNIAIINSIVLTFISIIMFRFKWISQIIVWTMLIQVILMFNKNENMGVRECK